MNSSTLRWLMAAVVPAMAACVHRDFPSPDSPTVTAGVTLAIEYPDTAMPLHTTVDLAKGRDMSLPSGRHIVKVYGADRTEVASLTLLADADAATLSRSHQLTLAPGDYTAVCWTDFTTDGSDWHYDTSAYPTVELGSTAAPDGSLAHTANTRWRDAFCGAQSFTVTSGTPAYEVPVTMSRPMGRFIVEATDYSDFIAEHYGSAAQTPDPSGDPLPGYSVTFRYPEYMPSSFSLLADAPVDSRLGAVFYGEPMPPAESGAPLPLGSDYVFVHMRGGSVSLAVELYRTDTGELVSRAGPFTVPLARNRLTIVRGRFLTANANSGISIDTGFAGDYNIQI